MSFIVFFVICYFLFFCICHFSHLLLSRYFIE
jgi:hypothetical protein